MQGRTGFVINVTSCPVLWKAVSQTEVATSTMESEVFALTACCRELIPIIDMVDEVGKAVGLSRSEKTNMHVMIHKDNAGALILVQKVPHQFTIHSAIQTQCHQDALVLRILHYSQNCVAEILYN